MTHQRLFLVLVALQAAHSVEEFTFGLYDWLGPFRALSSAIPGAAPVVFAVLNAGFFILGLWAYLGSVRPGRASAGAWITIWCVVEIFNGIGHPLWSWMAGAYVPGTATAPFLLMASLLLLWQWNRDLKRAATRQSQARRRA